ncbi:hypothetical protein HDU67_003458 [Dinochytrium kinnereticum]|nr:hypothetical protein HDU67_003458 [Dinochytrium kinnereticum]
MKKNRVTALAVYGQKQHWVGAGELNICTKDKQYIGIITILDVILHLGKRSLHPRTLANSRIVEVIGSTVEGRTLWIGRPDVPLLRSLEPLAKGVHRLLVPIWSPTEQSPSDATSSHAHLSTTNSTALSHTHAGDPSYFALASQSDVVRFLHHNLQITELDANGASDPLLQALKTVTPRSLGFVPEKPYAVKSGDPILPTLTAMASLAIQAVPVIQEDEESEPSTNDLHRARVLCTLSTSDFRRLVTDDLYEPHPPSLPDLVADLDGLTVAEFIRRCKGGFMLDPEVLGPGLTCTMDDSLERIVSILVAGKVHRLWVLEEEKLVGVFSLTDVIKAALEVARNA